MTVYGPEQYSRYSRYSDELDETRAELDALKAAQEWQPWTEKPPAPGRYFVWTLKGDIEIDSYEDGSWRDTRATIIFWQPRPAAPKGHEVEVQP